jgi:hypothetical protein
MAIGQNSIQDLSTYRDRVFSDISQLLIEMLSSEFFENETFKIVGLCFHDHPAFEDYGEKDDLVRENYTTINRHISSSHAYSVASRSFSFRRI